MNTTTVKKKSQQKPAQSLQSVKKTPTGFRPLTLTRHPSYSDLKANLPKFPFKSVIRFGSTTMVEDAVSRGGKRVEVNEIKGVRNSSSKLLMKQCFTNAGVKTADWWTFSTNTFLKFGKTTETTPIDKLPFPLIVKSHYGSRGEGNYMCNDITKLNSFISSHNMSEYIIEHYRNFVKEYRLHITEESGCFYTCRKMLKSDTPEAERFQRHNDNCVWYLDSNPKFDRPCNWNAIVEDGIKAMRALGLNICGFDVRVQSTNDSKGNKRENPDWIYIESCSAPSMAEGTTKHYLDELPKVIMNRARQFGIIK